LRRNRAKLILTEFICSVSKGGTKRAADFAAPERKIAVGAAKLLSEKNFGKYEGGGVEVYNRRSL